MAFGIFMHRPDSNYDDVPAQRYQFPKNYLKAARQIEGDWVLYLEPRKLPGSRGYFALARVEQIIPDPVQPDMYVALIAPGSYQVFGNPVDAYADGQLMERGLLNAAGKLSGRAQSAIRTVSEDDFFRILEWGMDVADAALDRLPDRAATPGFAEAQTPFAPPAPQDRLRQLSSRAMRNRNFRKAVLRAYGKRCAVTGWRLLNGGGRAEVEAAHIKPVKDGGPDIVSNGLSLSGTVHWMFDRGLIGIGDDREILVSRQSNDPDGIARLINETGKLLAPQRLSDSPHPAFVRWHRDHCFKD